MADENQDDIDALLGSLPGDSSSDEEVAESGGSGDDLISSFVSEDTGDSTQDQAEESDSDFSESPTLESSPEATMRVPWVDFLPEDTRPKPKNLVEHLERAIDNANMELIESEQLVRDWYLWGHAHQVYYKSWISNGNDYFRSQVIFRMRRAKAQADLLKQQSNASNQSFDPASAKPAS